MKVVAKTKMVEHFEQVRKVYEKSFDSFVLNEIQSHPLFRVICQEVMYYLIKAGEIESPIVHVPP